MRDIKEIKEIRDIKDIGEIGDIGESSELAVAARQKKKEKKYWLNRLAGDISDISGSAFPCDIQNSRTNEREIKTLTFRLPGEVGGRALQLSKGSDLRLHILLAASVILLLDKYTYTYTSTDQRDIIVATPIANRENRENLINTVLVLRNPIDGHITFKEFLLQVGRTLFAAVEHRHYPIQVLAEQLKIPVSSLLQTGVLLENIHQPKDIAHIPLTMVFSFHRHDSEIRCNLGYDGLRYSEGRVRQVLRHLDVLMEQAFFNPDLRLGALDLLSAAERQRQLEEFNGAQENYPLDKPLPELLRRQAEHTPEAVAVVGSGALTYRQLDKKSAGLSQKLRQQGIRPDSIVVLLVDRSLEMVIGMLGTIKAGGAFLVLSPAAPPKRKEYILKHSGAAVVLSGDDINRQSSEPGDEKPAHGIKTVNPLLYTIYIPGSTGRPQAVMVEATALINFIYSLNNRFNCKLGPGDRCLSWVDIGLDISLGELFLSLLFGAAVHFLPPGSLADVEELSKRILQRGITYSFLPPALLPGVAAELERQAGSITGIALDKVLTGGEAVPYDSLREIQALKPGMQIINGYGPSEACICTTLYQFTPNPDRARKIPVGKPLPNTRIAVLDRQGKLLPLGCGGELYISGSGVARGYLNNPELTAEKFINKTLLQGVQGGGFLEKSPPGRRRQKLYKTNDLVRWLEDGNIEFAGIRGRQLEISGYRLEPAEIEHSLLQHEKIKEAVVLDKQTSSGDKILCAYVVYTSPGETGSPTTAQLVDFLSSRLPAFMIPQYVVPLDKIPLTPRGKVDGKSLPDPGLNPVGKPEFAAPGNEIEKKIAGVWKEILDKEPIGVNENFFEMGGNSLGILKLKNRLKQELEQDIPDIKFLEYPTIRSFYHYLERDILGTKSHSREKEIDPHEAKQDGANKLRLRRKVLGSFVDV